MTTAQLLQSRGASQDQLKLFELGLNSLDGEGLGVNSGLFQISSAVAFRGYESSGFIHGGSQALPQAMACYVQDDLKLNAPVKAIIADREQFQVIHGEDQSTCCEHLIVTIPYAVLRKIVIIPQLPPWKGQVIEQLPNTSVTRTFLQFKERVWEGMGLSGAADTDQIIMSVYPGEPSQSKRGILESYTAGPQAREMACASPNERLEWILSNLEKLFPGVRSCYEKNFSFTWDTDEWALGAYAYYRAGQVKTLYESAAAPVGRMVFAGDHTTSAPGWMESAIQSGERAAREVLGALGLARSQRS